MGKYGYEECKGVRRNIRKRSEEMMIFSMVRYMKRSGVDKNIRSG